MAGTKPGIEVEGGPQLRRAFRKLGDRAGDLKALHADVAQPVLDSAEQGVPVVSGRLRRTLRKSARKTGASIEAGRGIPYEGPIHFGWRARNIEPQPFLYDALDDRRSEVARKYDEGIGRLVMRFDAEAPR